MVTGAPDILRADPPVPESTGLQGGQTLALQGGHMGRSGRCLLRYCAKKKPRRSGAAGL